MRIRTAGRAALLSLAMCLPFGMPFNVGFGISMSLGLGLSLGINLAEAGSVCNLRLNLCPSRYAPGPNLIPNEAIWLDPAVPFCNEAVQLSPNAPPSSLVFIIDNSGSMNANDPDVARFKVVSNLLKDIYTVAPATKVGLVIFTRRLAFDHRDNKFFHRAFPTDTSQHDAFVPLTALNASFPGNVKGIDTLTAFLKHDRGGNLTYNTQRPASRNNASVERKNTRDGTDISIGFHAARIAMNEMKSDKSRQFFIFLSDGIPAAPDDGRENLMNEFVSGQNSPTTFTLFFDSKNNPPVAPDLIVQMTQNIKENKYSSSNLKSSYWAINSPGKDLEDVLQSQVIGQGIFFPTSPKSGTLSIGEKTFFSTGVDDKGFGFSKALALSAAGPTTQVMLNFTYTYIDTSNGKRITKEKVVPYFLNLQRSPGATVPAGMTMSCQEQGEIALFQGGKPISKITADDTLLETHLTFPPGRDCPDCTLKITPSSSRSKDIVTLPLVHTGSIYTGKFQREINSEFNIADVNLQHLPADSVVLTWVNESNPLDQIRKAYRFINIASVLGLRVDNPLAKTSTLPPLFYSEWTLKTPVEINLQNPSHTHWKINTGILSREDSLSRIGITLEATRAFTADIYIYSNHGQLISKFKFTLSPIEFEKLHKPSQGKSRTLRVLWDNRTQNGNSVGTGAYVIKTILSLAKIPEMAEDHAVETFINKIGVLRVH